MAEILVDIPRFHWADYMVFGFVLLISSLVGVFFGCQKKTSSSTTEFLMAGKSMHPLPVAFSLFVSWMSAISILGDPVDVYLFGSPYIIHAIAYQFSIIPIAQYIAPKFYRANIVSAYEYLGTRFNNYVRLMGSITVSLTTLLWLAIATYAPAIALSQASGVPVWLSIIACGAVSTFYTTLGGMKAVIWADTLQTGIMFIGQIAMLIVGCLKAGGIDKIYQTAVEGGRDNYFHGYEKLDLFARLNIYVYFVGGFFRHFSPYVSNQIIVGRYGTVSSVSKVRTAVYLMVPMYVVMNILIWLNGIVMYSVYSECDPYRSGAVQRKDQMLPLTMITLLGFMPGFPGLYLGSIFSASLSSMSSGISGLATANLKDIIVPLYNRFSGKEMSDKTETTVAKILVLVFGCVITALSFVPGAMGSTIFMLILLVLGLMSGPITGVFLVGFLFTKVKSMPVVVGFVTSMIIGFWLAIGKFTLPNYDIQEELPTSVEGCVWSNDTNLYNETTMVYDRYLTTSAYMEPTTAVPEEKEFSIYYLNAMLYAPLSLIITVGLALTIHLFQTCYYKYYKKERPQQYSLDDKPAPRDNVRVVFGSKEHLEGEAKPLKGSESDDSGDDVNDVHNAPTLKLRDPRRHSATRDDDEFAQNANTAF